MVVLLSGRHWAESNCYAAQGCNVDGKTSKCRRTSSTAEGGFRSHARHAVKKA